ncbi:hypothetical protein [Saccharicrinis sp. FJH54]
MRFDSQSCPMIHVWISFRAFLKRVFKGNADFVSEEPESFNMEENK